MMGRYLKKPYKFKFLYTRLAFDFIRYTVIVLVFEKYEEMKIG
jgi:hypothetical protein